MELRFLGQSAFALSDGDTTVLTDPFLTGNPRAVTAADEFDPQTILLSHGHADHVGDTVAIAKRSGATVVAVVELAHELAREGVEVADPNLGGTVGFEWGSVKLVPAFHTAVSPAGTPHIAAGLVIDFKGTTIYHLGDTCLFSDLALPGRARQIDVALVPIGGHYTMDRHDAVEAVKLIGARTVIPIHYDTFPPIETDAQAFKADVEAQTSSACVVLAPGESWSS
ncbi:metal-dependent hydrolase [Conexibacter sp. JD483]|uniref:metal-dependent hydrolase n=1 Tax=unclassified Conexibacter TaxID=2627773 RepID=UPI0027191347|nr:MULTISPECIES: metal-dependent hydrolase [unclassified Conexibacter]MDO8185948.1 metal-dependent hydrolase [Conexibacter sp. CPCC 205706]MDO8199439.1 metal-dependent hydrolase [Conexibacter sp. CPCC 205762]MDR9368557.1 metal-dependent hydrolase [Conexibacter sp. JD483]